MGRIRRPIPLRGFDPQPRPPCLTARLPRPGQGCFVGDTRSAPQAAVAATKAAGAPSSASIPIDASLRRITVHPYKGHPRSRTLTPEGQVSAAQKRQRRGRAPDLRKRVPEENRRRLSAVPPTIVDGRPLMKGCDDLALHPL